MKKLITLLFLLTTSAHAVTLVKDKDVDPAAAIKTAKLAALAANSVVFTGGDGKLVAGNLIGDIGNAGSTVTIQPGVVTNAKLATMSNSTIKCNVSGGAAVPSDCTGGQVGTLLGAMLGANNLSEVANPVTARTNIGALGTGLTNANIFVGSAGNIATSTAMSGDVAITNAGVTAIQPSAITLAKMANIANNSVLGNTSGGSAAPQALGVSSILDILSNTQGQTLQRGLNAWAGSTTTVTPCSSISSASIDWSLGNCFTKTLSANTTFTFSKPVAGQNIVVRITNPSTFTYTFPNTNSAGNSVLWASSTIPTASTGNKTDIISVFFDGTNFYGNAVSSFGGF